MNKEFYTPEQIANALGAFMKLKVVPTGTNTGEATVVLRSKPKKLCIGWMFSPEDYKEVSESDFIVCFMEPSEKSIPLTREYVFLPDPLESAAGKGMWAKTIRRLLSDKGDEAYSFISPRMLEDYSE